MSTVKAAFVWTFSRNSGALLSQSQRYVAKVYSKFGITFLCACQSCCLALVVAGAAVNLFLTD